MNLPSATGRADRHLEGFADPEARLRAGTPLPHGFLLFLKLLRVGMPLPHGFPLFLNPLKVGTPLPHGFPLFLKPLRAVTLPPQNFRPSGVLERAGRAFPSRLPALSGPFKSLSSAAQLWGRGGVSAAQGWRWRFPGSLRSLSRLGTRCGWEGLLPPAASGSTILVF